MLATPETYLSSVLNVPFVFSRCFVRFSPPLESTFPLFFNLLEYKRPLRTVYVFSVYFNIHLFLIKLLIRIEHRRGQLPRKDLYAFLIKMLIRIEHRRGAAPQRGFRRPASLNHLNHYGFLTFSLF